MNKYKFSIIYVNLEMRQTLMKEFVQYEKPFNQCVFYI